MSDATDMLAQFHTALNDEPGRGNAELRMTLHEEEHAELVDALAEAHAHEDYSPLTPSTPLVTAREHIARELADVVYVAYGTAHAFDLDLGVALAEVHRAAMSKLDPATMVVREDGKVMKPEGFVPPDMSKAV